LPVDWWAAGVVIYETIVGRPPFSAESPVRVYQNIVKGTFAVPDRLSAPLKDLLTRLLVRDPAARLGSGPGGPRDVTSHTWFAGFNWRGLLRGRLMAPFPPALTGPMDTSCFDDPAPEPDDDYDRNPDQPWEADLTLTVMERRRADLAQLSVAWSALLASNQHTASRSGGRLHSMSLNMPASLAGDLAGDLHSRSAPPSVSQELEAAQNIAHAPITKNPVTRLRRRWSVAHSSGASNLLPESLEGVFLPVCTPVCLPVCTPVCLSVLLSACVHSCLST
jgi:serine/threonine protein kinase